MVERILELLKLKGLTPSQFADEIGIQRSGMSHLLSGRNKPSLEFVLKVLKRYPDISPAWILQGTEEPSPGNSTTELSPTTLQSEIIFPEESQIKQSQEVKNISQTIKKNFGRENKVIEKIVIFYSDRTFREFNPE
jgi:transcriptional regulator with XRE-family HTH domain